MPVYHGKCHCGETQWEVTLEEPLGHILCHCDTCKELSGGAFTLNQIVPRSKIRFTKGGDSLKQYTYDGDSGKPVICYYCPNCTTHPYHHQTVHGDDLIVVRTGLLAEVKDIPVAAEIYGKARLSWQPEVAHTFETVPPP